MTVLQKKKIIKYLEWAEDEMIKSNYAMVRLIHITVSNMVYNIDTVEEVE